MTGQRTGPTSNWLLSHFSFVGCRAQTQVAPAYPTHTAPPAPAHDPGVSSARLIVLGEGNTAHEEVLACDEGPLRSFGTQFMGAQVGQMRGFAFQEVHGT